jgi:transcriptional regulator with XRE-family HTH domain
MGRGRAADEYDPDAALRRRVGVAIAAARRAAGWTQAELAEALCVSRFTVINLERGTRGTHAETVLMAAARLGLLDGSALDAIVRRRVRRSSK